MPITNLNQMNSVADFGAVAQRAARFGQNKIHVSGNGRLAFGVRSWQVRLGQFVGRLFGKGNNARADFGNDFSARFNSAITREYPSLNRLSIQNGTHTDPVSVAFIRDTIRGLNEHQLDNFLSGASYTQAKEEVVAAGHHTGSGGKALFSDVEVHLQSNEAQIKHEMTKAIKLLSNNHLEPLSHEQMAAVGRRVLQSCLPNDLAEKLPAEQTDALSAKQVKQLNQSLQKAEWNNDAVLEHNRRAVKEWRSDNAAVDKFLKDNFDINALRKDYSQWKTIMRSNQDLIDTVTDKVLLHSNAHKPRLIKQAHMVVAYEIALNKIFDTHRATLSSYGLNRNHIKTIAGNHAAKLRQELKDLEPDLTPHIANNQALLDAYLPSGEPFVKKAMGQLQRSWRVSLSKNGKARMENYMTANEDKVKGVMATLVEKATREVRRNLTQKEFDKIFTLVTDSANYLAFNRSLSPSVSDVDVDAPRALFGDDLSGVLVELTDAFRPSQGARKTN